LREKGDGDMERCGGREKEKLGCVCVFILLWVGAYIIPNYRNFRPRKLVFQEKIRIWCSYFFFYFPIGITRDEIAQIL